MPTQTTADVRVTDYVGVSESITFQIRRPDGTVEPMQTAYTSSSPPKPNGSVCDL